MPTERFSSLKRLLPALAAIAFLIVAVLVAEVTSRGSKPATQITSTQSGQRPTLPLYSFQRPAVDPRKHEGYQSAADQVQRERREQLLPQKPPDKPPVPSTNCAQQKCIALTFDDGPSPHTERLLDQLKHSNVKATFFVLGIYVGRHPIALQRMVQEGHQIGNHTWHHRDLTRMPISEVVSEIGSTNVAIQQVSGVTPHIMRPPFGATNQDIIGASTMAQILWSVDPVDWKDRDAQIIADRIVSAAHHGAIVLAHDVYPTTVDAMPMVIERLKAQGYTFATIDELLNQGKPTPPGEYRKQQL